MNKCTMKLAAMNSKGWNSCSMVTVYLRINILSLQREFLGLVKALSFHRMHDEESEKMEI